MTAAGYTALSRPMRVGDDSNGNYLDGCIGEVRISTVERSAAWLQTTARNLLCSTASAPPPSCVAPFPASLQIPFLTVGAQQAVAATATDPDCCRVVASDDGTRVTALTSSLSMVFDRTDAGGLTELRNEEEANRTQSRNGDAAKYNVFSTQVNDGAWHFERDAAGQIEVLEATPTRLRLRQLYDYTGAIHLQRTWTVGSMPRLAIDETLVLDSDQTIRGAQGLHARGATSGGATICPSQLITSGFGTYFYCAGQASAANRIFLVTDSHESYSDMLAVALRQFVLRTDAGGSGDLRDLVGGGHSGNLLRASVRANRLGSPHDPGKPTATSTSSIHSSRGSRAAARSGSPTPTTTARPDQLSFNFFGTGWFDAGDLHRLAERLLQRGRGRLPGRLQSRVRPERQHRRQRDHPSPAALQDPPVALVRGPDRDARGHGARQRPRLHGGREAVRARLPLHGPDPVRRLHRARERRPRGRDRVPERSERAKNYTLAFPDASTWFYLGADAEVPRHQRAARDARRGHAPTCNGSTGTARAG